MSTTSPAKGQEPKRQRGHLRVAAIMKAGVELFSEKGYDATTMTEIASRSGTAIASLYRFFPTKEALAEALLLQYAKHALEGLRELEERTRTLSLPALADAFVDYSVALQSERRFAIDLAAVGGASRERRKQFRVAMLDALGKILQVAIPTLPQEKATAMAVILLNLFRGVAVISDDEPPVRDMLLQESKDVVALYLTDAAGKFAKL